MAQAVTLPAPLQSLPLFVRLSGRPVILLGEGEAADAKRRLLDRAGADVVGEDAAASLAIVAIDDEDDALAAVARLKARGILVNAVDRSALCDFTLPAIVDRAPVLIAIGTSGVSAGLAAALRQRLEAIVPADLGKLALALQATRGALRVRWPDMGERRRALATAMGAGGMLDPLSPTHDVDAWLATPDSPPGKGGAGGGAAADARADSQLAYPPPTPPFQGGEQVAIRLTSTDPDDLTLRQARALASADRVYHSPDVPAAILDRARADAARHCAAMPADPGTGLSVAIEMAL
ncbi:bifunctional precorrin-2 dehydrogenase/sirohydrochlorin ferrochelatase [Sphingomonas sp. PP-CE-1G-424]|uniref:precorrin-2 dehydrogenase/sirohydrochlorin ferrochelatase family protein n=1 Tax=Sphingomonas sp. PP-CE-1G-424 TaxID=2135658 RepID=UPI0010544D16|nr:bifunctional precorrin-2 dehydrogenase/sirohydrochlorin ferrochelatase [Sphingomonas sp. PP-CE-1G-424]TCP72928.1 uroporphyrin-III C-methyltransferase/precorrin-2 dehydrogenase/sirohydrochlorin ferrochelatase [Sphingomonas sp. PP-CE-1G-424]